MDATTLTTNAVRSLMLATAARLVRQGNFSAAWMATGGALRAGKIKARFDELSAAIEVSASRLATPLVVS